MSYGEVLVDKSVIELIERVLDYIVPISFGQSCTVFVFTCTVVILNCNVWVCVCVGFVMCVFW